MTYRTADVPNPMFYMPGTKMLFGDAKDTCEGTPDGVIPCSIVTDRRPSQPSSKASKDSTPVEVRGSRHVRPDGTVFCIYLMYVRVYVLSSCCTVAIQLSLIAVLLATAKRSSLLDEPDEDAQYRTHRPSFYLLSFHKSSTAHRYHPVGKKCALARRIKHYFVGKGAAKTKRRRRNKNTEKKGSGSRHTAATSSIHTLRDERETK